MSINYNYNIYHANVNKSLDRATLILSGVKVWSVHHQ